LGFLKEKEENKQNYEDRWRHCFDFMTVKNPYEKAMFQTAKNAAVALVPQQNLGEV
jgi:hypothetical protein